MLWRRQRRFLIDVLSKEPDEFASHTHEPKEMEMASLDVVAARERMAAAGEGDHNLLCHSG